MIPVAPKPEPASFEAKVRHPGQAWLTAKGYSDLVALPAKAKVKDYWIKCLDDLLDAYDRVCAYASLRIAPVTGAHSVEHFAPKSRTVAQIYEWSNYRLVCAKMNGRKSNFTDVLDPFLIGVQTFELLILNGSIRPSPTLDVAMLPAAEETIARLKLDDAEMRKTRLGIINDYFAGEFKTAFLKRESPFIHSELARLNLLKP